MTDKQLDEFVTRYISEMRSTNSDESVKCDTLENLCDSEPDTAWRIITRLISKSPDMYLHNIGAGPLETFLLVWREFFERAVALAQVDTRFREALRYVRGVEIPAQWQEAYGQLWRDE